MNLGVATAPSQPALTLPDVIGFGSTGQETPVHRRRATLITSGTFQLPSVLPPPSAQVAQPAEAYVQNLLSTGYVDTATVRWDQHGQLFFHSPIIVGNARTERLVPTSSFFHYELRTRMLTLPIHWQLATPISTHTSESHESWTVTLTSTDPLLTKPDYFQRRMSELFVSAAEETFEEGTESLFSKALVALIRDYGNGAVAALESALEHGTDIELAREALRWLGAIDHSQSKQYRRAVLEKHLKASSARLRYATALGLAEMDDPAAIPVLVDAIRTEAHDKIRWHFQLVLDQLEDTKRCLSS